MLSFLWFSFYLLTFSYENYIFLFYTCWINFDLFTICIALIYLSYLFEYILVYWLFWECWLLYLYFAGCWCCLYFILFWTCNFMSLFLGRSFWSRSSIHRWRNIINQALINTSLFLNNTRNTFEITLLKIACNIFIIWFWRMKYH